MAEKKHALLVFSKPPIAGQVKTRLTYEFGGGLSAEQAAEFFRRSLFDVSEMGMHALFALQYANDTALAANSELDAQQYDFFLSTTSAENVGLMRKTFDGYTGRSAKKS